VPQMAKDYNHSMGYVDKADMLKSCYQISQKSKKWWHRIFWHFVDVTLVNAFIIYKLILLQKNLSLKDFRLSVADFLIGVSNRPKKERPPTKSPTNKAKSMPTEAVRTSQVPHFLAVLESRRRCPYCSIKSSEKRTLFCCKTCNVPLCIQN